jgi:hypothetical protein
MNRRAALGSLLGAVVVASTLGSCGCDDASADPQEVEDCDAEDVANRETDCGYPADSTPKKPVKKPTKKPKTKTRR